jgi:hypothetical protein
MTILDILNWIKNYKINTHAIASLVAFLPVFYTQNAQFHDAVNSLWLHVPNGLRGLIVAAGPLWVLYRNPLKNVAPLPGAIAGYSPIDANQTVAAAEQARNVKPARPAGLSGFGEKSE